MLWSAGRVGWLVHSCPQWPSRIKQDGPLILPKIGDGQCEQAQSFMFVVLPRDSLNTVLQQVKHMKVRPANGVAACPASPRPLLALCSSPLALVPAVNSSNLRLLASLSTTGPGVSHLRCRRV